MCEQNSLVPKEKLKKLLLWCFICPLNRNRQNLYQMKRRKPAVKCEKVSIKMSRTDLIFFMTALLPSRYFLSSIWHCFFTHETWNQVPLNFISLYICMRFQEKNSKNCFIFSILFSLAHHINHDFQRRIFITNSFEMFDVRHMVFFTLSSSFYQPCFSSRNVSDVLRVKDDLICIFKAWRGRNLTWLLLILLHSSFVFFHNSNNVLYASIRMWKGCEIKFITFFVPLTMMIGCTSFSG